jgi:hypothetical protein
MHSLPHHWRGSAVDVGCFKAGMITRLHMETLTPSRASLLFATTSFDCTPSNASVMTICTNQIHTRIATMCILALKKFTDTTSDSAQLRLIQHLVHMVHAFESNCSRHFQTR